MGFGRRGSDCNTCWNGGLIKPAVVLLVPVGVLGLSAAAFEHGWISFRTKLKSLTVVVVIIGFMGFIGWKAWPHEFEKIEIEWSSPSAIDTETPLSLKQLNAKASVDGDFVYAPSMGTRLPVGIDPLTVTFNPKDSESIEPLKSKCMKPSERSTLLNAKSNSLTSRPPIRMSTAGCGLNRNNTVSRYP
jgi:hypothetical protein